MQTVELTLLPGFHEVIGYDGRAASGPTEAQGPATNSTFQLLGRIAPIEAVPHALDVAKA